jgi:hypothetical protein
VRHNDFNILRRLHQKLSDIAQECVRHAVH